MVKAPLELSGGACTIFLHRNSVISTQILRRRGLAAAPTALFASTTDEPLTPSEPAKELWFGDASAFAEQLLALHRGRTNGRTRSSNAGQAGPLRKPICAPHCDSLTLLRLANICSVFGVSAAAQLVVREIDVILAQRPVADCQPFALLNGA